jgi:hypothetical protein
MYIFTCQAGSLSLSLKVLYSCLSKSSHGTKRVTRSSEDDTFTSYYEPRDRFNSFGAMELNELCKKVLDKSFRSQNIRI